MFLSLAMNFSVDMKMNEELNKNYKTECIILLIKSIA